MAIDEFKVSVTVEASQDQVWRALVDWKSQGEWMALTHVTSSVDDGGESGIGTEIRAFTGIGKFGVWDEMRVTQWTPNTFCAVEHYGRWIKGIGEFRLTAISSTSTRFDWYERIDAPVLFLALMKPGILIAVYFSLRRFARSVSTR